MDFEQLIWRREAREADLEAVPRMCRESGFFNPDEVAVAAELVQERLDKGPASGYHFIFADHLGQPVGYACYGPIMGTESSWDLYWIVVANGWRGQGLGGLILRETEKIIAASGSGRVYVETSSRDQYEPTRAFYEHQGYLCAASLEDFYAPGDAKVIYVKVLDRFMKNRPVSA